MAEVTGNIGGQPVELNNAATEATLRQLVKAMGLLAAKSGGGGGAKSQKEVDAELKKFHKMLSDTNTEGKKLSKAEKARLQAQEDATKAAELEADRKKKAAFVTEKTIGGLQWFTKTAEAGAQSIIGLSSDLANLGNSMTSAANIFNRIPLVGGILSSTFGAIAGSSEKLLGAFQQASSIGAGFGGSLQEMTNAASGAGMTVDKFGALLAANGDKIALLGKGSTDGAREFGKMTKQIRASGAADELARLGYSTEQINSGMAGYAARLQQTGKLQGMTTAQVTAATASYLKELDAVARLTGKNREAMQKEEEQRMKDAQYMAFKRRLDADGQKELEMIMQSLPAELQEGAKEVLATGTATSEAGVQFLAYMNKSGQNLAVLGESARKTGTIQKGTAASVNAMIQDEAKSLANNPLGDTLSRFGSDAEKKFMSGIYDAASRQGKLAEMQAQQAEEEKKRKAEEAELRKKGLDPAAMQGFQERIAQLSNQFTVLLATHMPTFMNAFDVLTKLINEYLVPALNFFMTYLKEIIIGFVALKGTMLVVGTALKAWNFFQQTKGTLLNPMIVKDVSGGLDLPGKGGKGAIGKAGGAIGTATKAAGALATVGNVAKVGGAVGAVVSAGMLVSDLSDISQREKTGEITKEEAKKERGGAVGGAAGGAGGAMAGAAAGAAIGSVVPVVGTVIGGIIGGAVGGWLGRSGGKAVGEAVAEKIPSKPVKPEEKPVQATAAAKPVKPEEKPAPVQAKPTTTLSDVELKKLIDERTPSKPIFPTSPTIGTATAVAGMPTPKTDIANTASTSGTATLADFEKRKLEMDKMNEEQKKKFMEMMVAGNTTPQTAKSQEQFNKTLEQLNTNTAEMIRLLKNQNALGARQIDITKELGSADIFNIA